MSRDRGAAAVELAIVTPLLLLLLFGIMDYGLWYGNSMAVKHAAYEAGRWGSTAATGANPVTGCGSGSLADQTACVAGTRATLAGATQLVRVEAKNGQWAEGNELLVCTMAKVGLTGLSQLPNDGIVRSKVVVRIEDDGGPVAVHEDAPPAGRSWGWCGF